MTAVHAEPVMIEHYIVNVRADYIAVNYMPIYCKQHHLLCVGADNDHTYWQVLIVTG